MAQDSLRVLCFLSFFWEDDKNENIHTRIVNEVERATKKENDLQGQITQEKSDREKADKTLQDNIDDEIEARETADEIEANTRSTNDAALQSQITSLLKRIVELELDKG